MNTVMLGMPQVFYISVSVVYATSKWKELLQGMKQCYHYHM